jgi:hypothetical protein
MNMRVKSYTLTLIIASMFVVVAGTQINTLELRRVSPSRQKVAVVESTLWTRLHGRENLYVQDRDKPTSRKFIGSLLNTPGIDTLVGLVWSPDGNRLAVVNNYDGSPQMVAIVDLTDKSGTILMPKPFVHPWDTHAHIILDAMPRIIRTKYTIRTAVPDDLNWLARDLSVMNGEHGDFLVSTCDDLGADESIYLRSH